MLTGGKVLLLYDGGQVLGGIETLIIRVARELRACGAEPVLVCRDSKAFLNSPEVAFHLVGANYPTLISSRRLQPLLDELGCRDTLRLVVAMDSYSALIASVASWIEGCPAVSTNWVPDFFRFIRECPWHPMARLLAHNYRRHYGPATRLMMADSYQEQARVMFGPAMQTTLSPIPLLLEPFLTVHRVPERDLLVSVGRLEHMKSYVLYLPQMLRELKDEGLRLRLHIYGEGPFQSELEARIVKYGVEQMVELRGAIRYDRLPEVYRSAGVFIGQGTAGLEAAAAGVPTIHAVPFTEDGSSRGTIFHGAAAGVPCTDPAPKWSSIKDGVKNTISLDEAAYARESAWGKSQVLGHDIRHHIRLLEEAAQTQPVRRPSRLFVDALHFYSTLRGALR